ncbi:glutaredoxin domain-containing protein [Xylophilus sp. GOD-11R]|uniref:glutaredoxin domain-containing protein n=1 Tax=Xylophilus sp. GOD-11R TaxID=3089814 RepID=UPI00298CD28F|nr:glutaredoxin domain-containing protein [Xylophilus sp. GOD-11R]WPB55522.1 glutaredoxin domain-containing protein [Xylophilus sp. GOD-11R]
MEMSTPARIKVFWQPGCSSCLRTKEFLTQQGIDFESIDVHNDPDGAAQLRALGARSVPVVALGGKYTLCQSFGDVVKFLDLKTKLMDPLPPDQLVAKLELVLTAAARYTLQFPEAALRETFRDRNRTPAGTAFHVFRVAEMGLQAAQQIELQFEGFNDVPPDDWSAQDIADWGLQVRDRLLAWWAQETDRSASYTVPTYYGRRTLHDVLERTAWHAAQHTRQLILMLESHGVLADRPLSSEDLAGLPVPDKVWDR